MSDNSLEVAASNLTIAYFSLPEVQKGDASVPRTKEKREEEVLDVYLSFLRMLH